jgi:glycosyltransferase involved in cell wall biosynthesis
MKKALLVAYHFPPLGGPGVFRTLKFTKYLPEFGYQPYLLTVKRPMYRTKDPTLHAEIPSEAKVHRTFSLENRVMRVPRLLNINLKWFYIPDENIGWLPFGVSTGTKLIKKENIDLIYTTSPVYTSLLIGFLLKRKTKKPLIVDFRDPWTDNPFITYPTVYHKWFERKLEKTALTQADYVTVAFDSIKYNLLKKYPFLKSKIETVTNGFDPDDFKNLRIRKKSKFTITHLGSIYGLLTAKPFLIALRELIKEKKELREKVEVLFVGNYGKETSLLVREYGLEKNVKLVEYVPHKKALEYMVNSQALLLLLTVEGPGAGIVPGKVFEYLASRKPIIALVPEKGMAANIIKSSNAGTVLPPSDLQRIKNEIFNLYTQWKEGKLSTTRNVENLIRYNRKVLTQRLAQIFEKIT